MRTMKLILPALIAATALLIPFPAQAGSMGSMEEASQLLQRIEANALDIREHAARVKTYNRFPNQYSWQAHAFHADAIRNRVNDIGELVGKLKPVKAKATDRQNKAINYVVPDAAKLADLAAKMVKQVNEHKVELETGPPEYDKTVNEIYELADNVVAAVSLAESWDEIRQLQKKVQS